MINFVRHSFLVMIASIITILLFIPSGALASTVQIQFTGTVSRIDGNYSPPISVGDAVSFTYNFDLDGVGYDGNGLRQDTQNEDYFYAEQVGGLRILGLGPETDTMRWARRDSRWNQTYILTGSDKEYNEFWSAYEAIPGGQYFYVGQSFYGSGGDLHPEGFGCCKPYAFVRYDLTVASISEVPIPGAVWLLGSGLFGMVAIRRRKQDKA